MHYHIRLILASLVASVGACAPAVDADDERQTQDEDEDEGEGEGEADAEACEVGRAWSGTACVGVPLLSVVVSNVVDAAGDSQFVVVSSANPVRDEPVGADVRAADGDCVIYERFNNLPTHEAACGDWGTVDVAGASLTFNCDADASQNTSVTYTPGAPVTVRGSGGDVFPAFEGTISTPERLALRLSGDVERNSTLTISWPDVADTDDVTVTLSAIADGQAVSIFCAPPLGANDVTITPTLTQLLPATVSNWSVGASVTRSSDLSWSTGDASVDLAISAISSAVLRP